MRRSRLFRKASRSAQTRLVPVMWRVRYEVYERIGESLKPAGASAEILVSARDRESAMLETKRLLDPKYAGYHYSYLIKHVKLVKS